MEHWGNKIKKEVGYLSEEEKGEDHLTAYALERNLWEYSLA
ncbi:hypothetical protein [Prevotella nigrescens]|nr:hypothetical protein [Prevotella nigrescens]